MMKNKFTFKSEATLMLIVNSTGLIIGLLVIIFMWLKGLFTGE